MPATLYGAHTTCRYTLPTTDASGFDSIVVAAGTSLRRQVVRLGKKPLVLLFLDKICEACVKAGVTCIV